MGSQQSNTVRVLGQDYEFDDIFAKFNLKEIDFLNYICTDKEKFEGDALAAKTALANFLNITLDVPMLVTDGNGELLEDRADDNKVFIDRVKDDISQYSDVDGFNLQLVMTGQCAPLIRVFVDLINAEYINPAVLELVLVNGKHNGQGLVPVLKHTQNVCSECNVDLVVREFNAFGSMGPNAEQWVTLPEGKNFVDCGTSPEFTKKVYDSANSGNSFAQGVIDYGIKFNSSIVRKAPIKIVSAVETLISIDPECSTGWDLQNLSEEVKSYIGDLIVDGELNVDLCQRLSEDLSKVVQCANYELKKIDDDLEQKVIDKDTAKNLKKQLYKIRGWFKPKMNITKANLVQFPFHDLSAVLMFYRHSCLNEVKAWGREMGVFFDIVSEKDEDTFIEVTHYVAPDPEFTRQVIEDMIFKTIEDNALP